MINSLPAHQSLIIRSLNEFVVFHHLFPLMLQDAEWPENSQDSCSKIAAIDNGLAFPFKHPDEWRACMFITYFSYAVILLPFLITV